jgi:hypothetical protein
MQGQDNLGLMKVGDKIEFVKVVSIDGEFTGGK